MEVTDDNLATLAGYLQQTLNPDPNIRRPAEKFLEGVEVNQNYPILLLHLVDKQDADLTIRVAASVTFKNYVKRNWPIDDDGADKMHPSDRETVRRLIVTLMLKSPEAVQKQLSDAVYIIGKYDFPERWPTLMPEMVEKFATADFHVINGVLRTAHSLFKRYRHEFKSDKLWLEIKHVLEQLAQPLTDLFVATIGLTKAHDGNPEVLRVVYGSLVLVCKVFYSLNYQDLPEFFEDNMPVWMPNLLGLLTVKVPCLENSSDDGGPGVMAQLRSEICECAALYALKYDEEFAPHAAGFVTAIWQLLLTTGPQPEYDPLVSNALSFLSRVADKNSYKSLFEDPATLGSICEKVVIPNMELRESDVEMFEDDPEEYVRRDVEGSDVDTRRRAACDLVRTLSAHFEHKMILIFGQYIQAMLEKYRSDPAGWWRGKDAALYLVTSLVSRGATERSGVTRASSLVDLAQFLAENVVPELQRENLAELPVLKADAIKYIMTFRSLLPKDQVVATVPLLIRHLQAEGVVCTYAACCIEKLIVGKILERGSLLPSAAQLLERLFALLDPPLKQNEYVMKAIMRVLGCLQEDSLQYLGQALPKLALTLSVIAKNPSKPHFNHYLFETLSLAVTLVTKANPNAISAFEDALFPIFQEILQQDIQEFMPYVFQMLSLFLELRAANGEAVAEGTVYAALLPCLLTPPLWERPGNVRPLVRLLCAMLASGSPLVLPRLNGVLGVFQKLIASKTNDHEGFYLIQTVILKFGLSIMGQYMKQIVTLLFQRLTSSKTTKYVKGLIAFFGLYAAQFGGDKLIELIDSVQDNLFGMYTERVLTPELQKVSGETERRAAAAGCVALLTSASLRDGKYARCWTPVMQALVCLLELPTDESVLPDDHFIEVDDTPGYEAAYSQLANAKSCSIDPLKGIEEPRRYLAESLAAFGRQHPGVLPPRLQALEPPHRDAIARYLQQYSQQIC